MRKKNLLSIVGSICLVLVLAALLLPACAAEAPIPAPAPTPTPVVKPELPAVTWKCQSHANPSSLDVQENYGLKRTPESIKVTGCNLITREVARAVKERTNGKFNIEIYNAGELFGGGEHFEAVQKGAVEMISSFSGYWIGSAVIGYTCAIPFSWKSPEEQYDVLFNTDYREIVRRTYAKYGVHYISHNAAGWVTFMTNFPVNSLADLKGKKLYATGIKADLVEGFGATAVTVEYAAELYTALQRGLVEGGLMLPTVSAGYGHFEVIKYVSLPPISTSMGIFLVNMDAWNRLPKEYQDILTEECEAIFKWGILEQVPYSETTLQEEYSKKGVSYITLSDEEYAKIQAACMPLWDKVAAMSPENAEIIEVYKKNVGIK